MSIKSKPTGLNIKESLLYDILKKINRLTQVTGAGVPTTTTTTTTP